MREVQAISVEKWLIMPGPVIAGHADAESECGNCHAPLSDQPQFELCVDCHTEVGEDVKNETGFHGRIPASERLECAACHIEHEGRDVDIVNLDEATFDHTLTDFLLRGAHTTVACGDCHAAGDAHREAATTCIGCHRADDPHNGELGEACDSCHNETDWTNAEFDHSTTTFPLTGAHADTSCDACHFSAEFNDVGKTCVACHEKEDVHKGRNGTQCADCHTTSSWVQLTFNHLAVSGFALNGGHEGITCQDCHRASDFRDLGASTCNSCHSGDDVHKGSNGPECESCHNVTDWRVVDFDHAADTGFPLPPGHGELACASCHTGDIHDELPRDCGGCHADDDVHKGQLGTQCETCHVPTSWTAQLWFDHDITRFPLLGKHADVACDECHSSAEYQEVRDYCVACHGSDDPHGGALGNQCDTCHNPADWQSWNFDHDVQTAFPLTGAHVGITCGACHADSPGQGAEISDDCSSCHRRDDPHAGRFGNNCGSCHSTTTFSRIEGM